jgi:hypothetical protein
MPSPKELDQKEFQKYSKQDKSVFQNGKNIHWPGSSSPQLSSSLPLNYATENRYCWASEPKPFPDRGDATL